MQDNVFHMPYLQYQKPLPVTISLCHFVSYYVIYYKVYVFFKAKVYPFTDISE